MLENEIIDIVNNNKSKSFVDCDGINMCLVKNLICHIVKPLTHICNVSFEKGQFPDRLKIAKVLPLFKSSEEKKFTNYRPESLLPQ